MKKPTRYSDKELKEFEAIVQKKIDKSQLEISSLKEQITELSESMGSDKADIVDSTISQSEGEMLRKILYRVQKYDHELQNAMTRIKNKSYGICSITGELIDKRRLQAVPTTTKSLEVKLNPPRQVGQSVGQSKPLKNTGKKIIEKVVKPKSKAAKKKVVPPPPALQDEEELNVEEAEMNAADILALKEEFSDGSGEEGKKDFPDLPADDKGKD